MQTEKTITLGDSEITIKKMPLGRLVKLLAKLEKLPEKFAKLDFDANEGEILRALPGIMAQAAPEFFQVMEALSGVPAEKWENTYGLDDAIAVLKAAFELNNFDYIKKNIQTAFGNLKKRPLPQKGATNPAGSSK